MNSEIKYTERKTQSIVPGGAMLISLLAIFIVSCIVYSMQPVVDNYGVFKKDLWFLPIVTLIGCVIALVGLKTVKPNETIVCDLFGEYTGEISTPGLQWTIPFTSHHAIFTGLRNSETDKIRCIDADGVPVDISVVFSFSIKDPTNLFYVLGKNEEVKYLRLSVETALKTCVEDYSYEAEDAKPSLSKSRAEISDKLKSYMGDEIEKVGIELHSLKINHLSLPPEIAAPMLKKQQAEALLKARGIMTDGVKRLVEDLVPMDSENKVENERNRVNLMIALLSEHPVTPTQNVG